MTNASVKHSFKGMRDKPNMTGKKKVIVHSI